MRMLKRWMVVWVVALVVSLLAGCSPVAPVEAPAAGGEAGSLTPVKVGVGYIPSVQFAPWYVGIEQGFFADEGLDVSLEYGFENDYLKLVGTDELQFLVGSGDQVVLGRAQGLPVRYVMAWFSKFPVVVFAKADAGIEQPADLAGKTVGIPGPFGASYVAYRAILEAGGLSEADVQTESIGFTQAAAVSEGTVDAAVDYAVNGPVVLAGQGISTTQLAMDAHLQIPSNGLITNEQTIEAQPELVGKLVRATLKSIAWTLEHPDEAFAISLKHVPEAGGENEAINRAIFDASLPYWAPPATGRPGESEAAAWEQAAAFMQQIGLVDSVVAADSLYTNEFVPQ